MNRRKFIKAGSLISFGFLFLSKVNYSKTLYDFIDSVDDFKEKIIQLLIELKREGSSLVRKIMMGKEYVYDPYTHYPYDGGIKDENSGYQLFFHAHRPNEYGHFHTFAKDENGDLIHLILISMNEDGIPIVLATVNRWVTGDKFVKANTLNQYADKFFVNPELFEDNRVVKFINYIFKAYSKEINSLFEQRDEWISKYVMDNYREPFEDRDHEIISYIKINVKEKLHEKFSKDEIFIDIRN